MNFQGTMGEAKQVNVWLINFDLVIIGLYTSQENESEKAHQSMLNLNYMGHQKWPSLDLWSLKPVENLHCT